LTSTLINLKAPTLPADYVFILEKANQPLVVSENSDGDLILEGICAVFDLMNDNHRVYEKKEYLPHLTYLNEKIKKGQLFGELDHPQSFDVSLKNVSHIIESLTYDEPSNSVRIRLRVLDTPTGRIAKTIAKAGGTISSSSRAAGQVLENGNVKLHKIFTYDLVAEPGFPQAGLSKVAEGLQSNYTMLFESLDSIKSTAITNTMVNISESFNFGDSVKIYKINNPEINTPQNNKTQMANDSVTKEEMNQYSQVVKKKFALLQENIAKNNAGLIALSESTDNPVTNKLIEYVNYMAGEMEKLVEYSNYLSTMLNKGIGYTEHIAEKVNNVIDYSDYLANMTEKNIHFSGYLGEKLNQSINYGEYVGSMTEKSIRFGNYLAVQLDKGLQYTEYVAEQTNKGLNFSNYLAENLNAAVKYSEYLGGNLQKGIAYSEYLAETMNQKVTPNTLLKTRKLLSDVAQLNESVDHNINENSAVDDIVSAVDGILTSIKSNSANAVLESKYPFLKLLNETNKQKFYALEPDIKTAIVETLRGAVFFNESEVINLMEAVMNKQTENTPAYIKFMPEKYKQVYEGMTDRELNWISAQAANMTINTPYQAKAFWDSRDLRPINERIAQSANINNQTINENQGKEGYVSLEQVQQGLRGYSNEYLESLKRRTIQ
jgi:hypothetical protein